jgi:hypothetical protein
LLDENGLGDDRTDAARTQESGERSDDMDEKDDEIAHLSILARTAIPQELWVNQQFAIDRTTADATIDSGAIVLLECPPFRFLDDTPD